MSRENKTFVNKTIKSLYLNQELEVSCWEMQGNGRTLTIIEHAAFEDIIFNKLHTCEHIEGFNYELEPLIGVASHPVFKCTMMDHSSSRKIIAIGEAAPSSLVNWISQQNPVIMASNRAFDRAAIRYLNLEGKVYSSEEISGTDADDTINEEDERFLDGITFPAESDKSTEVNDVTTCHETQYQNSVGADNPGDVVVNFGVYRGKGFTVSQIYETDVAWMKKTADLQLDSAGEVTKKQLQAIKDYLKLQENN